MRKAEHLFFAVVLVMGLLLCTACGDGRDAQDGASYRIYYVNNDETKIVERKYTSETSDVTLLFEEFLEQLAHISEKMEYETLLDKEISVVGHTLENGLLTLDFDENYHNLRGTREILVRASIVRTMVQLPGVERITFTVMGEQLMDASGAAVGVMAADTFIENAGNEINAYEKVDLKLYFANETGDSLVEENRRNVVYNSNISLEKLIVERLIAGPPYEGAYPTIPANTKLVSVTVRDGICYVTLDEGFLETGYNVTESIPIYSIVNSLVQNTDAQKVQISINGETNQLFRESISFDTIFERNEELVE